MYDTQNEKHVVVTAPAAIVDNASLTTTVIDTAGYAYCVVEVQLGATDIALTALKVQEADATSNATTLTSGADVSGLVFGTSSNIAGSTSALPSATADNGCYRFEINLRGRKRYLKPIVTIGDGTGGGFATVTAKLSGATNAPRTASERGFGDILRV